MIAFFVASLIAVSAYKQGSCPLYTSNKASESYNHTHAGGLWYEYLHTPDHKIGANPMECATWNLLSQSNEGGPFSYMMLHNAQDKTKNVTQFTSLTYTCGPSGSKTSQKCKYTENNNNPVMNAANQVIGAMNT